MFAGCWKPRQAYSESAFVSERPRQPLGFVREPKRQRLCKIDELVDALLLRGRSGGVSVSGDTASYVSRFVLQQAARRDAPEWICVLPLPPHMDPMLSSAVFREPDSSLLLSAPLSEYLHNP